MQKNLTSVSLMSAFLALVCTAQGVVAASVPAGVTLAAKQEWVRSNGSEPETLDPALAESVPANQIARDLFEGLTATDTSGCPRVVLM